jgi:hypothetical protein
MIGKVLTFTLAVSAFLAIVYALATPARPDAPGTLAVDTGVLLVPKVERMPPPQEPLDETPITPVESAGAPMWP